MEAADLGSAAHCHHGGIFLGGFARLSFAHGHQLRLLSPPRAHQSEKSSGRRGAVGTSPANDHFRVSRSPPPPSVGRRPKTGNGINPLQASLSFATKALIGLYGHPSYGAP